MITCRSFSFVFTVLLTICWFSAQDVSAGRSSSEDSVSKRPSLTIFTWSDYIDPDLVEKFENENGVELKFVYYETDEMRDEMMVTTNGKGYDVILINGASLEKYISHNWLLPIDDKKISNIKLIDKKWREAFPGASSHGVPYLWGTLGIGYRKDKVKQQIKSWMQLFKPDEALRGKIIMIKDSAALIGAALKAAGRSLNSIDPKEYREAEKLLLSQKSFVRKYSYLMLTKNSAIVTGEVWASMIYNGDALVLKEFEPNIEFVLPKEGGALWCDYLTISSVTKNKALAYRFIDFIHDPENNAKLAQFVYYATPNMKAEKLLPKDFLNDPVIYPDQNSLKNSEIDKKLPPGIIKIRNKIFSKVIR